MPRSLPLLILLAAAVLAGSAVLRFTGLDWLLPSLIEQDAHIPVQVRLMEGGATDAARPLDWGTYPHLVARLTQWLTPAEEWVPPAAGDDVALELHLARARWPVLRVRLVVALLSLLAVPASWLLARRFLTPGWSLLAAALVGTSLLAVHFGTQARAHGAALGLDVLAVLACMRLARRGGVADYALAGLAVAAAIACLQSGLATLPPLAVAHLRAVRGRGVSRHVLLAIPLACIALALLAFYPFLFEASRGEDGARLAVEGGVLVLAKHQVFLDLFNGLGFVVLGRALWEWEPALCVGAVGGTIMLWLARRGPSADAARRSDRLVMLAFVLPYALVIGLYQRSYERFLLPLVPFLALLAAWGVARLAETLRSLASRRALVVPAAVLLLGFPTLVAARLVALRLAPSTLQQAAAWVEEHAEPASGRVLLGRPLTLPLFKSHASLALDAGQRLDRGLGWASYQSAVLGEARPQPAFHVSWIAEPDEPALQAALAQGPRRWVTSLPADIGIIEPCVDESVSLTLAVVTAALRDSCERLARLSPDGEPDAHGTRLAYQDEAAGAVVPMAWRVLHAARCGPVLEIFRLPREGAVR